MEDPGNTQTQMGTLVRQNGFQHTGVSRKRLEINATQFHFQSTCVGNVGERAPLERGVVFNRVHGHGRNQEATASQCNFSQWPEPRPNHR